MKTTTGAAMLLLACAFGGSAYAQDDPSATFVGFANKTACKTTPCGGYNANIKCCSKLTSSVGACPCSMYYSPQDVVNWTNATWQKVDWPLDDLCAQTYPGSRAATMLELTKNISGIPQHYPNVTKPCVAKPDGTCQDGTNVSIWSPEWIVPGCLGAREGEWPSLGPGKTWFCSQVRRT